MTCNLIPVHLNSEQQGRVCGVLSMGCDWTTAANLVGCSLAAIRRSIESDAEFANDVRRAEAQAELGHMRTIHEAAKDAKNWRASVWWLERRAPERFGSRRAGVVTAKQLKAFIAVLADVLAGEEQVVASRADMLVRLQAFAESVDQLLKDERMSDEDAPDFLDRDDELDDATLE